MEAYCAGGGVTQQKQRRLNMLILYLKPVDIWRCKNYLQDTQGLKLNIGFLNYFYDLSRQVINILVIRQIHIKIRNEADYSNLKSIDILAVSYFSSEYRSFRFVQGRLYSSVSITTSYGLDDWGARVRFSVGARSFSSPHCGNGDVAPTFLNSALVGG
jgi:hypothetical protein